MKKVLILGGYGNFGARIAKALVKSNIPIIIAGRDTDKTRTLLTQLKNQNPTSIIDISIFDAKSELNSRIENLKPTVVINTIWPFQTSDYSISEICIENKAHQF